VRIVESGERKTEGGIILAPNAVEKPYEVAEVVAIGPGKLTDAGLRLPLEVAVGEWVCFRKHAGAEVDHQGEQLKVLQERELFAVQEQP
jgi:chaperonin GroES